MPETMLGHLHAARRIAKQNLTDLDRLIAQLETQGQPSEQRIAVVNRSTKPRKSKVRGPSTTSIAAALRQHVPNILVNVYPRRLLPEAIRKELQQIDIEVSKKYLRSWLSKSRKAGIIGGEPGEGYTIASTSDENGKTPTDAQTSTEAITP